MKSLLQGLEQAGGDVSGEDAKLRDALSALKWGRRSARWSSTRAAAIANNYLFKVTNGQSRLLDTKENVNQTLGFDREEYIAAPPFDRENPSCS